MGRKKIKKTGKLMVTISLVFMMLVFFTIGNTKVFANETKSEQFEVYFQIDSQWNDGYIATIKVKNTNDIKIENWQISFEYPDIVQNIWNAEIVNYENGKYYIKNKGFNH